MLLRLFLKFLLALNRQSNALFRIISEIVAPTNCGKNHIAEFFFEFIGIMSAAVFGRVTFPATNVAKSFAEPDNNLFER